MKDIFRPCFAKSSNDWIWSNGSTCIVRPYGWTKHIHAMHENLLNTFTTIAYDHRQIYFERAQHGSVENTHPNHQSLRLSSLLQGEERAEIWRIVPIATKTKRSAHVFRNAEIAASAFIVLKNTRYKIGGLVIKSTAVLLARLGSTLKFNRRVRAKATARLRIETLKRTKRSWWNDRFSSIQMEAP